MYTLSMCRLLFFQEMFDRLRPLAYPGMDVGLVSFEITSSDSFENLEEKWLPEICYFMGNLPRILVGTKSGIYICCQRH